MMDQAGTDYHKKEILFFKNQNIYSFQQPLDSSLMIKIYQTHPRLPTTIRYDQGQVNAYEEHDENFSHNDTHD